MEVALKKMNTRHRGPSLQKLSKKQDTLSGSGFYSSTWHGVLAHTDKFISREFMRHLPRGSKMRFLDVGCSPGRKGAVTTLETKKRFERNGIEVDAHGVDLNLPTELNKKKLMGEITYHTLDVERDEMPEGNFDLIRATNVL